MIHAKVAKKPFIEIPEDVYDALGLNEGEVVQITIKPAKKQLSKEDKLKILEQTQGIWADDDKIAEVFSEYLEESCEPRDARDKMHVGATRQFQEASPLNLKS